jgi:UPF0176 protein
MKKLHNKVNKEELKQKMLESNLERTTLSFYKYAYIKDVKKFRNELYKTLKAVEVYGRIYVSDEGINGQVSVPSEILEEFKTRLYTVEFLDKVRLNIAIDDDGKSFYLLKIKTRKKIVADGLNDKTFNVTNRGVHLSARGFNEITNDSNTVVIDMRNHYETEVGHFENAVLPDADTFREALPKVEKMLQKDKDKNIVMYCTGGIRCEKASAYYKHKGFKNVFQLDGGIIEYARQVEQLGLENKFIGKNFVFDNRMGERISEDIIANCHQCEKPCDTHINCANDACHILFIQCDACAAKFQNCCSGKCIDFIQLPPEEQDKKKKIETFNGTKFSKGRYKAHDASHKL